MGNAAVLALAALLIVRSQDVMLAARRAAEVFASGVMPALFPMMVLSNLAHAGCAGEGAGEERVRRGSAAIAAWWTVLFSFVSGSPASAQRVRRLEERGELAPEALEPLAAATGVMSPMFIMGALAARVGRADVARVMLCAHWLGALVAGGLAWAWARHGRCRSKARTQRDWEGRASGSRGVSRAGTNSSLAAALPGAVSAAMAALLSVLGAMMLFSIAACLLDALATVCFPAWAAQNARALAVCWALMEIGGGAYAVLDAFAEPPAALLCALCSFGGLSVWLQNLLFLGDKIRPGKLFALRALHGAASYGICAALLSLFCL